MPINVSGPVEKKKLSETVEQELERIIRQGELAVGDVMPSERELMKMFGVGRPSVRDALAALARKGLVKISSGERTRVTQPSAGHIISELEGISRDFLLRPGGLKYFDQLRQFFESSLVRYAAEFATPEQVLILQEALDLNERSIEDFEQFKRTDMNFHRVIAEIPENPIFFAVHQALVNWVISERPIRSSAKKNIELNRVSFLAHKQIFEKIRDRDVEGADQTLKVHLQYVYDHYYD